MKILLIDNGTSFLPQIQDHLAAHQVTTMDFADIDPDTVAEHDAVILSGGHRVAISRHEGFYAAEMELILAGDTPLFGICLGFELIARAFGATLTQLPIKEHGLLDIVVSTHERLFENIGNCQVFESHRWAVQELPTDLVPIATSKDGIEALRHRERPIFAVQFHPEVGSDTKIHRTVLENFLALAAD